MAPSTADSDDFQVPDSELEDGAARQASGTSAARRTPMPADKIVFPRSMLYVEAVLYLLLASASFGLGYLIGHGHSGDVKPPSKDAAVDADKGVRLAGTVTYGPQLGPKQPDAGAVVIALPDSKWPNTLLSTAGLRPGGPPPGPNDANLQALTALGGAATRADKDGRFSLSVPRAGYYRILVISQHAKRPIGVPLESNHMRELGKYFADPDELFPQRNLFKWPDEPRRVQGGMGPIDNHFTID